MNVGRSGWRRVFWRFELNGMKKSWGEGGRRIWFLGSFIIFIMSDVIVMGYLFRIEVYVKCCFVIMLVVDLFNFLFLFAY